MKITKIFPRGYCYGVVRAIMMAKKVAKNHKDDKRTIYMIGMLVHNIHIVNEIRELGIILIDDRYESRLNLVKKFDPKKSILIFTAHGTPKNVIKYVEDNNFTYYDTVCPEVVKSFDLVEEKIKDGFQVIFLGVKNHPETLAMQEIDNNKVKIITEIDQLLKLDNSLKTAVLNQTTLSSIDLKVFYNKIEETFKNVEMHNDLCKATIDRQRPLFELDPTIELVIVCGDQKSNNSNALMNIVKNQGVESILVNDPDLITYDLIKKKHHIAITAGASTPTYITNKVIKKCNDIFDSINNN